MPRRARGEGSLYQHPKGWCAVVDLGRDERGRRNRKTFYAATKAKVLEKRDRWRRENGKRPQSAPAPATQDVADTWLEHLREQYEGSEASVDLTEMWLEARVLIPPIDTMPINRVTTPDLEKVLAAAVADGLARGTLSSIAGVIRRLFRFAVERGHMPKEENPAAKLRARGGVKEPRKRKDLEAWSPGEVRRFVGHCTEKLRFSDAALVFILRTGLRVSELRGLRWRDVNLSRGLLQLRQQLTDKDVIRPLKSKRSRRTLHIGAPDVALLRKVKPMSRDGFVFGRLRGCSRYNLGTRLGTVCKRLGFEFPGVHGLRHMHGSHLLDGGATLQEVSDRLGHASLALTVKTYMHRVRGSEGKALAALERFTSFAEDE